MKTKLMNEYCYKTELHCHTQPVSGCSRVSASEMVQIYKNLGVDTVVLTNHFYIHSYSDNSKQRKKDEVVDEYLQAFRDMKACAEAEGITTILGMEIRFTENINDYLLYGLTEADVPALFDSLDGDLEHFCLEYKKENHMIFQAHPFRDGMVLADPKYLDGIEAFNMYPRANSRVALARAYAQEQGMQIIGGSDCHVAGHEGCCLLRTKHRIETSEDLVQTLKSKEYIFEVFGSLILP